MEYSKSSEPNFFLSLFSGPAGEEILNAREVAALIKFASENGSDKDELVSTLFKQLREYEESLDQDHPEVRAQTAAKVLATYTKVTEKLGGINGRNLLQGRRLFRNTWLFMTVTTGIFIVCVFSLALGEWMQNEPVADDFFMPYIVVYYLKYFTPFFWGALGACVYILKKITDVAADNRFDLDKFQGWQVRALLGAVLGGIITFIIDTSSFGEKALSTSAIAFLAGLGTKVVYGALQRLIQIIGEKMNLESLKQPPRGRDAVTDFLAKEISRTNPDEEEERYAVLTALLDARSKSTPKMA